MPLSCPASFTTLKTYPIKVYDDYSTIQLHARNYVLADLRSALRDFRSERSGSAGGAYVLGTSEPDKWMACSKGMLFVDALHI